MEDLSANKNKLLEVLGDNSKKYLELLNTWFKKNLTKTEFDNEARKLLNKSAITYHNKFLVSLFSRCQSLVNKSLVSSENINQEVEPKRKKVKTNKTKSVKDLIKPILANQQSNKLTNLYFNNFENCNLANNLSNKRLPFCSSEAVLPDYFMSNLRLFVNCWEFGMDGITDDSINLVNLAIRDFIKNIISSLLIFKSEFRDCENQKFRYAFGTGSIDPFILNTSTFKIDKLPESNATIINENGDLEPIVPLDKDYSLQNALVQIACSTNRSNNEKINLWHLYYCLKNDPTCIPIYSIKAPNIERIQMKLIDEQAL